MNNLTASMKDVAFATSPREFDLPYSTTLEEIMQNRVHMSDMNTSGHIKITNDDTDMDLPQVITPIISEGDVIGSVILRCRDNAHSIGTAEQLLARCAAGFMGKQLEQ